MEFNFRHSLEEYNRALSLIPEGIKGMHKINAVSDFPAYFSRAQGPNIWDADGNQYLDYVLGKGPFILGYGRREVDEAVIQQIQLGNIFPMGNKLHNKLAQKLIEMIPAAEQVLYYKTGTCGTSAAVRIARAFTQKEIIFSSGYHGWQDWCNEGLGIPEGVSQNFFDFKYSLNQLDDLIQKYGAHAAAVIITPEVFYFNEGYYQELEKICHQHQLLFIVDEVKTGFRVDLGGFQKKYSLNPDLAIFSKAISNGYALSVVAGKKEVMAVSEKLHTAGTYDIEVMPIAAALKTIELLSRENTIGYIEQSGRYFAAELEKIFYQSELGIHPVFAGGSLRLWCRNLEMERNFYAAMAQKGVLFYAYDNSYLSSAHTKEILDRTLEIALNVAKKDLAKYQGSYLPFSLESIKELKNKKGFLNGYPGPNGRN